MDTSQPRPRAGEEPTPKELPAGQEPKGWDDDLNFLQFKRNDLGLCMPIIKQNKNDRLSMVMAVEAPNDLSLIREMATGMLILYNVTQIVLQCCQTMHSKALPKLSPLSLDGGLL